MDLGDLAALEDRWQERTARLLRPSREYHLWEPYPLPEFARLLDLAVLHAPWPSMLDVGCGIGTKCLLAASCGLDAHGIERLPVYLREARRLGTDAELGDARTFAGYGRHGIVYINCPLIDDAAEAALERLVQAAMAPGAVLVSVNDCGAPPGWEPVADERDQFRGVYIKPGG